MKQIILESLTLRNFKGEKERTTQFNADVTTITGDNKMGKTRHFTAFLWLLFGKDEFDRKDYEVRTKINGAVLHEVECSVSGVIVVDGERITLKRAFVEDWVKPRGCAERVFKGNHTECWWNDTPVNVSEYDKRINGVVDATLFKMITNPAYFASLDWKQQREMLFKIAGTISDTDFAAKNPEFAKLLDRIKGKSLADFKKELSARKNRLKEQLAQIQPRIDQTQKMMPENEDFHALEVEIDRIDAEIADIDKAMSDAAAALRRSGDERNAKQSLVNKLKSECQQIIFTAKTNAQSAAFDANSRRREIEEKAKEAERNIDNVKREIKRGNDDVESLTREIECAKKEQDQLRKDWYAEDAKVFTGETVCPHCGQGLPAEMIDNARDIFNKAKVKKCGEISEKGVKLGEKVASLESAIAIRKGNIAEDEKSLAELMNNLDGIRAELGKIPVVSVAEIVPESIPEWVSKQKEISELEAGISTDNSEVNTTGLQTKKAELNNRRQELVNRLANRDALARGEKEIAELEASGKQLAQQLADAEREEYTIEQFTKAKIEECETRVNSMFKWVSFRLFDYTIQGNPVETCVPLVDGVSFGAGNTAGRVQAGIDIINVLSRFFGVCAPIFIDCRESVNEIPETQSQIINLVVNKDKFLTIK